MALANTHGDALSPQREFIEAAEVLFSRTEKIVVFGFLMRSLFLVR